MKNKEVLLEANKTNEGNSVYKSYINKDYDNQNAKHLYTVTKAGISKVEADFYIDRDTKYPYNNIHVVCKGSGIVEYKSKQYPVKEGQLFILNAFDSHVYRSVSNSRMELSWVEFTGGNSIDLTRAIIENASSVFAPPNIALITKYIDRILNISMKGGHGLNVKSISDDENKYICMDKKDKDKYIVSKLVYSMLVSLYEFSLDSIRSEMPVSEHSAVKSVINYIDQNLGNNLEVEKLAEFTHFSPDYFSKIFKKATGDSPAKYVNKRRITMAKELICEDVIQIDEIAYRLGFCDSSHFIKTFKKAEGLTPAEFRRQSKSYTTR